MAPSVASRVALLLVIALAVPQQFHSEVTSRTQSARGGVKRVLGGVRAYRGGDIPEDVLGALDKTVNLNWEAANKLLFQIGRYCIHNTIFYEFYGISYKSIRRSIPL